MLQNQARIVSSSTARLAFAALAVGVLFTGCKSTPQVEYSVVSVSQEGGIRFSPVTDENDNVLSPEITRVSGRLSKKAQKYFDISRDGTKIAYLATRDKKTNIYVRNLALGGKATVQRTFRDNISDVAMSPDGRLVAFTDRREGNLNVYLTSAEAGSAIRQVTSSPLNEFHPAFSPDGRSLLYVQNEPGGKNDTAKTVTLGSSFMWVYDLARGTQTQYAEGGNADFAPDSKKVVFSRNNKESGNTELWMLELDTGQEILVSSDRLRGYMDPAISPDGTRIAFASGSREKDDGEDRNLDVYIVNVDGSNLTQLTFHPGDDVAPRWAPDGRTIFFLSQRGSSEKKWNIWKMELRLDHFDVQTPAKPADIEVRPLR